MSNGPWWSLEAFTILIAYRLIAEEFILFAVCPHWFRMSFVCAALECAYLSWRPSFHRALYRPDSSQPHGLGHILIRVIDFYGSTVYTRTTPHAVGYYCSERTCRPVWCFLYLEPVVRRSRLEWRTLKGEKGGVTSHLISHFLCHCRSPYYCSMFTDQQIDGKKSTDMP
jgi:hypothetical protein